MMTDAIFRGDCDRCAGLCCFALAFDRGPLFGLDKPAGKPCCHLNRFDRCTIHHRLAEEGFAGCAAYDCLGAGQIVTALFAGHSWRKTPAVGRQAIRAFAIMREVQALRLTLGRVAPTPGADPLLDPPGGWTLEALLTLDLAAARARVLEGAKRHT